MSIKKVSVVTPNREHTIDV